MNRLVIVLLAFVGLVASESKAAGYYSTYIPNKCTVTSAKGFELTIEKHQVEKDDVAFYNGLKQFNGSIYSVSMEFSKADIVLRVFNDRKMVGYLNLQTDGDLQKGNSFQIRTFSVDPNMGSILVDCSIPRD